MAIIVITHSTSRPSHHCLLPVDSTANAGEHKISDHGQPHEKKTVAQAISFAVFTPLVLSCPVDVSPGMLSARRAHLLRQLPRLLLREFLAQGVRVLLQRGAGVPVRLGVGVAGAALVVVPHHR